MLRKLLNSFRNSLTARMCPVIYNSQDALEIEQLKETLADAFAAIIAADDNWYDHDEGIASDWRCDYAEIIRKAIQHQEHKIRNVHM